MGGRAPKSNPNGLTLFSEKLFFNAITLPLHKDLTYEDQEKICQIIKTTLSR